MLVSWLIGNLAVKCHAPIQQCSIYLLLYWIPYVSDATLLRSECLKSHEYSWMLHWSKLAHFYCDESIWHLISVLWRLAIALKNIFNRYKLCQMTIKSISKDWVTWQVKRFHESYGNNKMQYSLIWRIHGYTLHKP